MIQRHPLKLWKHFQKKSPDEFINMIILIPKKKFLKVININPDLLIQGKYRGKDIVGGIKIHISKTNSLSRENRKNVATMIHQIILEQELNKDKTVHIDFCISIDVFNSNYDSAPKKFRICL